MWSLMVFAVFLAALTHTKAKDEEDFALVGELNKLQTFFCALYHVNVRLNVNTAK